MEETRDSPSFLTQPYNKLKVAFVGILIMFHQHRTF